MKKHFLKALRWGFLSCLISVSVSCTDEATSYPDVDGKDPEMTLVANKIECAAGQRFTIKGTLTDADGIVSVNLKCTDLYLNKTIDLVDIYGEPQTSYELEYNYDLAKNELGELFKVDITVTDVGGRAVTQTVEVSTLGDFENPTFTVALAEEVTVLIPKNQTANPSFTFNCSVTDDQGLDYILITIPGITGYENGKTISARDELELKINETIHFPDRTEQTYNLTITAVDLKGKVTSITSKIDISGVKDFPKMYLADVETAAELNSDIFGVPMVMNHIDEYEYEVRYYNKSAGTKIFFIPQKNDFNPVCFGIDPENTNELAYDPATVQPIVLNEGGKYYKITVNIQDLTYTTSTYEINDALNPMPSNFVDNYGTATVDFWDDNDVTPWTVTFFIGFGGNPASVWTSQRAFIQDKTNKHLFYYPGDGQTWYLDSGILEDGGTSDLLVTMPHGGGWWGRVEWRNDVEVERFGYYNSWEKATNSKGTPYISDDWKNNNWNKKFDDGTDVTDTKFQIKVTNPGNYRFEFDTHLGRAKIVPVN